MQKTHYLDHACLGHPSQGTVDAVGAVAADLASFSGPGTDQTTKLLRWVENARQTVSHFLGVLPSQLALVDSTTHGLGVVAASLGLKKGDNVLVSDQEFVTAAIIWRQIRERTGVVIRPIKSRNGVLRAEDYFKKANQGTRAITLSSVQEVSGVRVNLERVGAFCLKRGIWLLVDGIQEVGALPINLARLPVHAYSAGGHKWLKSPFGTGFLYVEPALLAHLDTPYVGYFGLNEPDKGWKQYLQSRARSPFDPLPTTPQARRVESGGTPNWTGAVALAHSVSELQDIGQRKIWNQIQRLGQRLRIGLSELDLRIVGDANLSPDLVDSPITTFSLPGGLPIERRLVKQLEEASIFVSLRYLSGMGGIRVSPHFDNSTEDIDCLLGEIRRFLEHRS